MESIILGFSVVFPLLIYMTLGYGTKKLGWLKDDTINEMNSYVFKIFMPITLFLNAYAVDISTIGSKSNIQLILYSFISTFFIILIAEYICYKIKIDIKRKAVIVQSLYRGNLAIFGLTVSTSIYGDGNIGILPILVAILIPLYNVIAAVLLTKATGKELSPRLVIKNILSNPLVIGSFIGLILSYINFKIPSVIFISLSNLSRTTTPLAFILLGAGLIFSNMKKNILAISITTFTRLVVVPIIILGIAVVLNVRNQNLIALLSCFGSPVAVSSYTMIKNENVAPELGGEIVAITTVMSILSIFSFIVVLGFFNLI